MPKLPDQRAQEAATTALPPPAPVDFETALAELEDVLVRMESGDLSLEHSLESYRRGAQLLNFCRGRLADAAQQVKVLEGDTLQDLPSGEAVG